MSRLETISSATLTAETLDIASSFTFDLLNAFLKTIEAKIDSKATDLARHFDTIVLQLYRFIFDAAPRRSGTTVFGDERLLNLVAKVVGTLFTQLDAA